MTHCESDFSRHQTLDSPYSEIWQISEKFREYVDAWDFKHYVFGLLLYRYLSLRLISIANENERESNSLNFDFAAIDDKTAISKRELIISKLGYYIPPSELYENVLKQSGENRSLTTALSKVFKNIEASSAESTEQGTLKGLFRDLDLNSLMLDESNERRCRKLQQLMEAIAESTERICGGSKTSGLYGRIFEFLMTQYAISEASYGHQYFSPIEISELLVRIATLHRNSIKNVYDPACGTGSLLMKCSKIIERGGIEGGFFGQELNISAYNLCRMNMIMHGIDIRNINIEHGNTLLEPKCSNQLEFDVVVSNLSFSSFWRGQEDFDLSQDVRYSPAGVLAPKGKGELAFVMHSLAQLSEEGTAALSFLPGVLHRRGTEQKIRKYLVDSNFIDAIIQLPRGLFFDTTLPVCVIVLKKNRTTREIFFYDASEDVEHSREKSNLGDGSIARIIKNLSRRVEITNRSKNAGLSEIERKNYNLTPSIYTRETENLEKIEVKGLEQNLSDIIENRGNLAFSIEKVVADITRYNDAT